MKKSRILAFAAAAVLSISAFAGYVPAEEADTAEAAAEATLRELYASIPDESAYLELDSLPELGTDRGYTIGCAMTTVATGWFKGLYDNLNEKLLEAGCEVKLVECGDDANEQVNQIETFISQGVDGIIINPANPQETVTQVLEAVADAGIPVVAVDVPPEEGAQYMAACVTDAYSLGRLVGEEVAKRALEANPEGEIEFGIIGGTDGNSIAAARNQGERDGVAAIDTEGRMKEVSFLYSGDYSEEGGLTTAQNMLAANPNIKVIFGTCDAHTVGATSAAEQLGLDKNLIMGAVDGSKAALEIMKADGPIVALGLNSPYEVGEAAARVLLGYLEDGTVPTAKTLQMEPTLVTPENVDDYYNPDAAW